MSDWDELGAEGPTRSAAAIGYEVIEIPLFDPASVDLPRRSPDCGNTACFHL